MSITSELLKAAANEYGSIADDGLIIGDVAGYIDTGSYILNVLLSGSLKKGAIANGITVFAGEEATGKTYLVLSIAKSFQDKHPEGIVVWFDSEPIAIRKEMLLGRGIDLKRFIVLPVATVTGWRSQTFKILDKYLSQDESERVPLMCVLDSIGNLTIDKESEVVSSGASTRDMGERAQLIKGALRVLSFKFAVAKVPLFATNHIYVPPGQMYASPEMTGGMGLKYNASATVFLSKRKEKDSDGDVIGNIIHCKNEKARFTVENKIVDVLLSYQTGLDRYYGLVDLAVRHGIFNKAKTSGQIELPSGKKTYEKTIYRNPEEVFTEDVMNLLEGAAAKEFLYGSDKAA